MTKETKPKKIKKPTDKQYREAEREEALSFCPRIYPCAKCGWPVVNGYRCSTCGTDDPGSPDEENYI